MYQPLNLAERSNKKRKVYHQNIFGPKISRWCKTHVPSMWVDGYKYCNRGYKTRDCIEGEK